MGSCEIDLKYVNGWLRHHNQFLSGIITPLDNNSWTSTIPLGLAPGQYVRLRLLLWSTLYPHSPHPPSSYGTKCALDCGPVMK